MNLTFLRHVQKLLWALRPQTCNIFRQYVKSSLDGHVLMIASFYVKNTALLN